MQLWNSWKYEVRMKGRIYFTDWLVTSYRLNISKPYNEVNKCSSHFLDVLLLRSRKIKKKPLFSFDSNAYYVIKDKQVSENCSWKSIVHESRRKDISVITTLPISFNLESQMVNSPDHEPWLRPFDRRVWTCCLKIKRSRKLSQLVS